MNFSSHIIINAPAEAVWDIIGRQFDRIGEWATAIPASAAVPQDVPGEPTVTAAPVAGRVCDTGIRMLPQATEMIIAYSDRDRTLTYQATGMPAYVGVARNRWTITAVDQQRTRAAFEAVFAPRGILGRLLAGWLRVQIGRTGRHLLGDLKHYAEHGVPSPRKQAQLDRAGRTGRACDRAGAKEPPERADLMTPNPPGFWRPCVMSGSCAELRHAWVMSVYRV